MNHVELLDYISPECDHETWVKVGMALKAEGLPFHIFDEWSAQDMRPGQYQGSDYTEMVWNSFNREGITGATLTMLAKENGYVPKGSTYTEGDGWDAVVIDDYEERIRPKASLNPMAKPPRQIVTFLETLFKADEFPNVITSSFADDSGKYHPHGIGLINFTTEYYINSIRRYEDQPEDLWFNSTFGQYDHGGGVWIRVNPCSGKLRPGQQAISDSDITRLDYALIECDSLPINEQLEKIKELELPYKTLVYSGGKSVHALVRIDALSIGDYKERVKWMFKYCAEHGFPVDEQNSNPSRMTRLPGVDRGNERQSLLDVNPNAMSYDQWKKLSIARDESEKLPMEPFSETANNLPPMAEPIIDGILRCGHKMIVSGPSKAGKSFFLISLAIAIAEGADHPLGKCRQGRVLYLNFEVDRPSFLHRIADVYDAMGIPMAHPDNLFVMNLRGRTEPLDVLAPKLSFLLQKKHFDMVIVDPIYKIMTGDENNASDMGKFSNYFDALARDGHCAIAYCHHHSKGSQAQKSAIDRASGSGVFARDPDAIVDLTEVDVTDRDRERIGQKLLERLNDRWLHKTGQWENLEKVHPDWLANENSKSDALTQHLELFPDLKSEYEDEFEHIASIASANAYRMSIVLREFASPPDKNVFFAYPVHVEDTTGILEKCFLGGDNSVEKMNKIKSENKEDKYSEIFDWYEGQREEGYLVKIQDVADEFGISKRSVERWVDRTDEIKKDNAFILYQNEPVDSESRKQYKAQYKEKSEIK